MFRKTGSYKHLIFLLLLLILSICIPVQVSASTDFHSGVDLLNKGKYTRWFGKGAIDYFRIAYENDRSLGPEISNQLISYADRLIEQKKLNTLIGIDAIKVFQDALTFDFSQKSTIYNKLFLLYKSSFTYNDMTRIELLLLDIYKVFPYLDDDWEKDVRNELLLFSINKFQNNDFNDFDDGFKSLELVLQTDRPEIKEYSLSKLSKPIQSYLINELQRAPDFAVKHIKKISSIRPFTQEEKKEISENFFNVLSLRKNSNYSETIELADFLIEFNDEYAEQIHSLHYENFKFFLEHHRYNDAKLALKKCFNPSLIAETNDLLMAHALNELEKNNNDDALEFYNILFSLKDDDHEVKNKVAKIFYQKGKESLAAANFEDAFDKFKKADNLSDSSSNIPNDIITTIRTFYINAYNKYAKNNYKRKELKKSIKILDLFARNFESKFSENDKDVFHNAIELLLNQKGQLFIQFYNNFKFVLSTYLFDDLNFHFSDEFKKNPLNKPELLRKLDPSSYAYLYYDTSLFEDKSRGIALTDSSLIWENLVGEPQKVLLKDVENLQLKYKKGLSFTGWQLLVNNNQELSMRLSGLSDDSILTFLSLITKFIKNKNEKNSQVALVIPQREKDILNGAIWERHKDVIFGTVAVATVIVTTAAILSGNNDSSSSFQDNVESANVNSPNSSSDFAGVVGIINTFNGNSSANKFKQKTPRGPPSSEKPYMNNRPSYAPGQVDQVWENAKDEDGIVRDPNTGKILTWDKSKPRTSQWDMGHKPGKEYHKLHKDYVEGKISKEEYIRKCQDPENYHPEDPSSNRSHKYEEN